MLSDARLNATRGCGVCRALPAFVRWVVPLPIARRRQPSVEASPRAFADRVACCCIISSGRRSRSASAHQGNPERIFHIFFGVRRRCGGWWRGGSIERGWRVFDRPVGVVTGAAGAKLPQRVLPAVSPRQRRAVHRSRPAEHRRDRRRHHGGDHPARTRDACPAHQGRPRSGPKWLAEQGRTLGNPEAPQRSAALHETIWPPWWRSAQELRSAPKT
jgi:hypothetical protein